MPRAESQSRQADTPSGSLLEKGRLLYEQGDLIGAQNAFLVAKQAAPNSAEALARLATTYADLRDWPAAEATWQELLESRPNLAVALTGLGIAQREQNKTSAALATFTQATEQHPDLAAAHFNYGTCLLGCGRSRDAVHALKEAKRLDPESAEIRFNLAIALIQCGWFATGAAAYEARWQGFLRGKQRPFSGPRWTGHALPEGQKLVLWGEQGIGDEIMFAGLVPEACRAAEGPVILECAPRLVPLFARAFPQVQVIPRTNPPDQAISPEALHCPLGSLPGIFWRGQPEAPAPYLRADHNGVEQLHQSIGNLGSGPKIGITWRGGHPAANRPRTIAPEAWAALASIPNAVPVCLQYGATPDEVAELEARAGIRIHRMPGIDALEDMDSFAALVAALDAVVGVDNSTIHLAGALGVPTVVLLGLDSDWRWGDDGVACPWYRNVHRIRQRAPDDWIAPMAMAASIVSMQIPPISK